MEQKQFVYVKKEKKCRAESVIDLVYDFRLQNVHKQNDKILSTIAMKFNYG